MIGYKTRFGMPEDAVFNFDIPNYNNMVGQSSYSNDGLLSGLLAGYGAVQNFNQAKDKKVWEDIFAGKYNADGMKIVDVPTSYEPYDYGLPDIGSNYVFGSTFKQYGF